METSKVYVKADEFGLIVTCNGGYTTPSNLDGWTQIDEGTGDRYNLCQSHYFQNGLYTEDGIPCYKLVDGKPVKRTAEEIQADRDTLPYREPSPDISAIFRFAQMQAQNIPDEQALSVPTLYDEWRPDTKYGGENQTKIVRRGDQLYRCKDPHTSQKGWEPENVPALWVAINKSNDGTKEDPIPAVKGMEYTYGLYYLDPDDQQVYLCKRIGEQDGGKIVLQYLPHELVGQYFESS